jgi:hypothetical protein
MSDTPRYPHPHPPSHVPHSAALPAHYRLLVPKPISAHYQRRKDVGLTLIRPASTILTNACRSTRCPSASRFTSQLRVSPLLHHVHLPRRPQQMPRDEGQSAQRQSGPPPHNQRRPLSNVPPQWLMALHYVSLSSGRRVQFMLQSMKAAGCPGEDSPSHRSAGQHTTRVLISASSLVLLLPVLCSGRRGVHSVRRV